MTDLKLIDHLKSDLAESLDLNTSQARGIAKLQRKIERAKSLIDGVIPIVCLWQTSSPAQVEWKEKWMDDAKQILNDDNETPIGKDDL